MEDDRPTRRPRSRSRSPESRPKRGRGGFRWKDDRNRDSRRDRNERDDPRDGRRRSPVRDRYNDRDRYRDRDRDSRDDRGPPRGPRRDRDRDFESKRREHGDEERKDKKKKKAASAAPIAGQEMIIVNINDRLGTKTAIPCLPSDTVGQLKLMVAARIGREASQIMLKRQGERPFKDIITLEDYGISHGVQLDLEVDTGD
ncbi:hypothetical protein LIA77_04673 [Sarocladium implicatum]|nr:hypothetical protein LIA77_04673 [Sarocladium implicatum]